MSMLEKYIINRLENVEAENEELRAANRTLEDRIHSLNRMLDADGVALITPEVGKYYFTNNGAVLSLGYTHTLTVDGDVYVFSLGDRPDIALIDEKRYFLDKDAAKAQAEAEVLAQAKVE